MRAIPVLLLLAIGVSGMAQRPWTLGAMGRYGFLWPHRPNSWILVEGHASAAELFMERRVSGEHAWHHHHRMPAHGFSLLYTTLGNPGRIGHAAALVPYLYLPFARGERSSFGMRLGWGLGYVTKPFDRVDNHKQIAIGSRVNTAIRLAPEYRWEDGRWLVVAGAGLDHWSNGAVKLPNLGLNMLSVHVGAGRALGAVSPPVPRPDTARWTGRGREQVVVGAFGVNEAGRPLNGQHSVFVLSGQVQWDTGPMGRVAAGMDLFNKGSLASINAELADSDRWSLTQLGVHGGYALVLGRGELFLQMGVYVHSPVPDEEPVFHRIGGRYHSGRRLVWHMALKSHYAVADHWEFGAGYRWR